jgi:hypothetical protein
VLAGIGSENSAVSTRFALPFCRHLIFELPLFANTARVRYVHIIILRLHITSRLCLVTVSRCFRYWSSDIHVLCLFVAKHFFILVIIFTSLTAVVGLLVEYCHEAVKSFVCFVTIYAWATQYRYPRILPTCQGVVTRVQLDRLILVESHTNIVYSRWLKIRQGWSEVQLVDLFVDDRPCAS